jgi:hypothetical protein
MPDVFAIPEFYSQPSLHLEVYDEMAKNGWAGNQGVRSFS